MKKGIIIGSTVLSIFLLTFIVSSIYYFPIIPAVSSSPIDYTGHVCTTVTRADGTVEGPYCDHNVLYGSGKNMTRDCFTSGGCAVISNISLCNQTSDACEVVEGGTFTKFGGCGMDDVLGTTTEYGIEGNWTVSTTFTSSCDNIETNTTQLKNASGSVLAANSFTAVTLQTSDQLTINWTVGVS